MHGAAHVVPHSNVGPAADPLYLNLREQPNTSTSTPTPTPLPFKVEMVCEDDDDNEFENLP